ncbi:hypothetical protein [Asanoa iriomotensis]|uniref:Nucleoside 2-deoxyribosyltransferase n=1 Tax=Asanoa iriomotensis TaxID=234613 RepID=A0ABQ4BXK7_9ACTN|nr:hypothetical protein [Asanoa iriomotensis]GIF55258.1 hypothetical protein Air01nite_13530 [Asanoa iriomotensis]
MQVAIIGSFKQHYSAVREALASFRRAGIEVTTPKGAEIQEEGIAFVRFHSDPPEWDDSTVQTIALHRILRADAVYVVAPGGYVGRTTCYEIGRIFQAARPIYFSEHPDDLPVAIPGTHIVAPIDLVKLILTGNASSPFAAEDSTYLSLERRLLTGDYSYD